jgi:hypothetical protein
VNVAVAEPFSGPVPSSVTPSLNVTVPVGVPADELVTTAVNVTDCPVCAGLLLEVRVTVVEGGGVTVKTWAVIEPINITSAPSELPRMPPEFTSCPSVAKA